MKNRFWALLAVASAGAMAIPITAAHAEPGNWVRFTSARSKTYVNADRLMSDDNDIITTQYVVWLAANPDGTKSAQLKVRYDCPARTFTVIEDTRYDAAGKSLGTSSDPTVFKVADSPIDANIANFVCRGDMSVGVKVADPARDG
jgi:acyl-coenzyme A synthetase/AMP-(fatty) acid ligase